MNNSGLFFGRYKYKLTQENRKQPLWTTTELARKVGTNATLLSKVIESHNGPNALALSRDGGKKYGLHDFSSWWKKLPDAVKNYALSTNKPTEEKMRRASRMS